MLMDAAADSHETVVDLRRGAVAIAGRPVVRGVDLAVGSGEFVALMGANGSGKSTLVRGLTGLRPLATGTLRLFGTPLAEFRDWHRVGFVPQRTGASSGVASRPSRVRAIRRFMFRFAWCSQ